MQLRILIPALALLALGARPPASAQGSQERVIRLAVLDLSVEEGAVAIGRASSMSDWVRTSALVLPADVLHVMTRENMLALLPPDRAMADCTEASCEMEFGRLVGADLVITGRVSRLGGHLHVHLRMYRSSDGVLLSAERALIEREEVGPEVLERATRGLFYRLGVLEESAEGQDAPAPGRVDAPRPGASSPGVGAGEGSQRGRLPEGEARERGSEEEEVRAGDAEGPARPARDLRTTTDPLHELMRRSRQRVLESP